MGNFLLGFTRTLTTAAYHTSTRTSYTWTCSWNTLPGGWHCTVFGSTLMICIWEHVASLVVFQLMNFGVTLSRLGEPSQSVAFVKSSASTFVGGRMPAVIVKMEPVGVIGAGGWKMGELHILCLFTDSWMFCIRLLPLKYSASPGGVDCVKYRWWPVPGCCLFRVWRTSAATLASSSGTVCLWVSDEGMTLDLWGESILLSLTTGTESPSSKFSSIPCFEMSISSAVVPFYFLFFDFRADPWVPLGGILLMNVSQLGMRWTAVGT